MTRAGQVPTTFTDAEAMGTSSVRPGVPGLPWLPDLPAVTVRAAQRTVAAHSRDSADCAWLLAALGIDGAV